MVYIDTTATLESFRKFLINSTCLSFIPESYLRDPEVFPEKDGEVGSIYVEAGDKVTLKKIREITFINARDVLGIIYVSKSGNTRLKWRQTRGKIGKVTGEASANSLVNLITAGVITKDYIEKLINASKKGKEVKSEGAEPFAETEEV
ncbi:MAG: hypothetical protein N3F06_04355 [Nitrososphaerales archaeon]|nr:hypothetical protein [Nitrososphaerales archaeon]